MSTITKWDRVHSSRTLSEVLGLGLVEVGDHRHEAEVAQFLSQPVKRPSRSAPFFLWCR
jgi:hypothetical protein